MTTLNVTYRDRIHQITVLNKWDVEGCEIVRCRDVRYADVGKMLAFDDGSEWFSPIIAVSNNSVRTECGLFHRNDIVCVSRVKVHGSQYSGLFQYDEHILVYPPTRRESERVTAFLANEFNGKLSRRELMITIERLQQKCQAYEIDEEWIVKKLKDEADNDRNRGFERLEAVKLLARIAGVDIGGSQATTQQKQLPLFGNINLFSIQDRRREELSIQRSLHKVIEYVGEIGGSESDKQE